MQTFLPYPSFEQSAAALDYRRLGKQRVEAYQILRAIRGESKGWTNHPATKIWTGYEYALCTYGIAICDEWIARGYNDSLLPKFLTLRNEYPDTGLPSLIGDEAFHLSHQSNLKRKDPQHYTWEIPDDLPYVWSAA